MKSAISSQQIQEREEYISSLRKRFTFEDFNSSFNALKGIKVLCIGDVVVDRYTFVDPKGRALKDSILSSRFIEEEDYAGGVLAVVNHISSYADKVKLVSLIGAQNSQEDFIKGALSKNIESKLFIKEGSPTTIKQRFVDYYKRNKLFKIEYMNDSPISADLSSEIVDYLNKEVPKYDLVMVLDYDHGFLNSSIREFLQEKSKFLSINVQVNSANMGYNYVTNYKTANFVTLNDLEMRLPLRMQFQSTDEVIDSFNKAFDYDQFLVTTGKRGCTFFSDGKKYRAPIMTNKVVDTVGAGDSIFAITSLLVSSGINDERIPFIANCAGGIDSNILGNKEYVDKETLLHFIETLYKGEYNGLG